MPIRITGMNSGLDTESIITALTQTKQDKLDNYKGDQKKLTWKQDKWKELNKKVNSFYNGVLSNMRFSSAYSKKTTVASKPSAVSIVTGENAMNTIQKLSITSLSKNAYMTGDAMEYKDETGKKVKASSSTTMDKLGISGTQTLDITVGEKTKSIEIKDTDKVSDVVNKLKKEVGSDLDVNFDDKNGRFYISSKTAGASGNFSFSGDAASALGLDSENYIKGTNAVINLNGVEYESNSNTFEINGLTITANEVEENITLTTKQDTSGIYDNIKNMIKEYNELVKEMSTLYNADKAKKYSMLTDDQKDAMSEKEVEEWENKIKDGLLSGDETLGNIRNGLKEIIGSGFDVTLKDGTTSKMYLASFGVSTASYFNTEENERDMLHIDGDADDSVSSGNTDILNALISTDPDAVQSFFTKFSQSLYGKLSDLMKGSEFSTAYTIYEDKLMASQYSAYNTKISDAQKALEAAQDKLYKKFSVMETALAKINSSSGSLSSFFGGGSN